MELRQIKLFLAVAEEGHFGRAAARTFISQPALSQHIRRLERELEVQLFDRSSRQVRLTPAGEAFLQVAQRMSRQVTEATLAARRAEAGEVGSLALGVHVAVAAPVMSVLLRHWSRVRPAVAPRLASGQAGQLIDLVRRRDLDVALLDGPVSDQALTSTLVVEDEIVVVLPADHSLATKDVVSLRDLADERFVAVSRTCSTTLHDRLIEMCGTADFSPDIAVEVEDADLVPLAVSAGLGLGLTPRLSIASRVLPGLVCRPLDDRRAVIPLVAVSLQDGAAPQAGEFLHLIEDLRQRDRLITPRVVSVARTDAEEIDLTDVHGPAPKPGSIRVVPDFLQRAV
jgi:DNA-binding transcriptional LysR family regulator